MPASVQRKHSQSAEQAHLVGGACAALQAFMPSWRMTWCSLACRRPSRASCWLLLCSVLCLELCSCQSLLLAVACLEGPPWQRIGGQWETVVRIDLRMHIGTSYLSVMAVINTTSIKSGRCCPSTAISTGMPVCNYVRNFKKLTDLSKTDLVDAFASG
jgi:hypothetical protein